MLKKIFNKSPELVQPNRKRRCPRRPDSCRESISKLLFETNSDEEIAGAWMTRHASPTLEGVIALMNRRWRFHRSWEVDVVALVSLKEYFIQGLYYIRRPKESRYSKPEQFSDIINQQIINLSAKALKSTVDKIFIMNCLDELLISSSLDPHEVVVVKGETVLRVVLIELVSNG